MAIQIPFNWQPEKHQLPVLQHPARFKVLNWHRKAHKTTLAINELIRWCFAQRGTYWYVAPFYNQAKKIVWQEPDMLAKYCPPEIWATRNNSDQTITFPNGSVLYVLGADKPDSLRGPNPKGVALDEYADMRSNIWPGIIQPIMTSNPTAWTWFLGTPKGKNDFYSKFTYATTAKDPSWWGSRLRASESRLISAEALAEAKRTTTKAFYDQEYEVEFMESATSFFRRVREKTYQGEPAILSQNTYHLGVDLAKYQDWTVITPFCENDFRVFPQDRFNQIDWNIQKARIEAAYYRYHRPRVKIDSTGLGDPIMEDLKQRGVEINTDVGDNFKFTEASRRQLLDKLAILIEQGKIWLPEDEELFAELESMQYTMGDRGKIKVQVPDGMHDDRIMSLALATWGVESPLGKAVVEQSSNLNYDKYELF